MMDEFANKSNLLKPDKKPRNNNANRRRKEKLNEPINAVLETETIVEQKVVEQNSVISF
jgi:hypothetical protein